jgi:hypothetical protein
MVRSPQAPHSDDFDMAVNHFNAEFRHRYRLPDTSSAYIRRAVGFEEAWADIPVIRAGGVADASCAVIAKTVLLNVPQYAIGLIIADGTIHVLGPDKGNEDSYLFGQVLLVNPLGGWDNWTAMSRWFRRYSGTNARQTQLASLASEARPNEEGNRSSPSD